MSNDLYERYTPEQRDVILLRGENMLVSASAGTGKTTVMIERIAKLIKEGVDVSQIVVVTFTNLAAAEMKTRLSLKLAEYKNDARIREQLEYMDNSAICTLHSFCSDLLRNYFYVVDIDPAFVILDNVTINTLRKTAMEDMFKDYFDNNDQDFKLLYKIFATNRKEDNFKSIVFDLHSFSRCIVNFNEWYNKRRCNFTDFSENNIVIETLRQDIQQNVSYYASCLKTLTQRAIEENIGCFEEVFRQMAQSLLEVETNNLQTAINDICKIAFEALPRRNAKVLKDFLPEIVEKMRADYDELKKGFEKFAEKYQHMSRGRSLTELWQELQFSVKVCDKLVEVVNNFDSRFYALKKQRGGVDFNDLEHLTLQLLNDEPTLDAIHERYKMVFVDEYQDTNHVQEAIVTKLCLPNSMFMVGDVKQSIYGFRGCEPDIFVQKQKKYAQDNCGQVIKLNANFRSNVDILDFVNVVFEKIMTASFGKVDYKNSAKLEGTTQPTLQTPSVRVDLVLKEEQKDQPIVEMYDISAPTTQREGLTQGQLIAHRIKQYVGMAYKDKNNVAKRIEYGDIVILMRGLTDKATDIYNTLIQHKIPVTANFKADGFAGKEIREIINLLRVLDNPYSDVYLVGVCLSCFGCFSESQLGQIRLKTTGRVPFFDRLLEYTQFGDEISQKIKALLDLLESLRFYAHGATVCDVVLKVINLTQYNLHVQGLPNGMLRYKKLCDFIDGLRGATYAQSIDKFLAYIDETDDNRSEQALSSTNAVRMMTMHASKGLEFPVVIVAGVESHFVFDERAVERTEYLGLATKYYDFSTMKKCMTLGSFACGLFNKTKQREEEMRLLYVAMTRARFVLDVVGSITQKQLDGLPKLPSNALCHLDWLLYALKQKYPTMQCQQNKLEIQVISQIEQSESSAEDLICNQYTDKDKVLEQINYQYPYASQVEMPSKVVSSALDKQYLQGEDVQPAPVIVQDNQNVVGTAYHTVYQFVDYNADVTQIQQTIDSLVEQGRIPADVKEQIDAQKIHATLTNPQFVSLISKGEVYHEIPFMLYVPYDSVSVDKRFSDQVMLQGVLDLLVIDGDYAVVVDFKLTKRSDKLQQRYPYQLNSYKLAVQQICGITNVDAYILSIEDNKLVKM